MDIYLKCDTRLYGKRDDFNFAIIHFPPPDSNMPAALAYGVYISKLTCCSCRQSTCLHVFGSCCDVRYYFRVKQCPIRLDSHLFCKGFIYINCICIYLCILVCNAISISDGVRFPWQYYEWYHIWNRNC